MCVNPFMATFGIFNQVLTLKHLDVWLFSIVCRGYLAPEYATRGQLSEKVDVFSFGVLVLEIVTGRKNIEPTLNEDQTYLLEWVSCKFT